MTQTQLSRSSTSVPSSRAASAALWTGVGLLLVVTALRGPLTALVLMAVLLVPLVTARAPEYVLVAGVVGTLAGGSFNVVSSAGGAVLVLGAFTSAFSLALSPLRVRWQRLVLPLTILAWLALRVALEQDLEAVSDIARCVAALVLALHALQRRRDLVLGLAVGGVVFVLASAVLGVDNLTGTRFEGISGNPNRMVFGLLMLLPFMLSLVARTRRQSVRLLTLGAVVAAVVLVVLSGSAQGVAGLATILAVLTACLAVRLPRGLRAVSVLAALGSLVLALGSLTRAVESSPDLRTLSGRTSIYVAAVRDILRNPWAGSGRQRFTEGAVVDRSAHSVVLALAATGGIPLALGWVAVLVLLLGSVVVLLRAGNPLAAAPAVLVAEQLVQTVELIPLTWTVVALFLLTRDGSGGQGRAGPSSRAPERYEPGTARGPLPTSSPAPPRRSS